MGVEVFICKFRSTTENKTVKARQAECQGELTKWVRRGSVTQRQKVKKRQEIIFRVVGSGARNVLWCE